jgi:hypothetical protein
MYYQDVENDDWSSTAGYCSKNDRQDQVEEQT